MTHEHRTGSSSAVAARQELALPQARFTGRISVSQALATRRSRREFAAKRLTNEDVGQLCWAAQGITGPEGLRTAPSAGAIYPLTLYLIEEAGVYVYEPYRHVLQQAIPGDVRPRLQAACLDQECVREAPQCLVIVAQASQLAPKYGSRAERYCLLEAGHVAQNVLLQAAALGLAAVPVGAFDDRALADLLQLAQEVFPAYVLPLGHPAEM